ncbi:phosphotransferase enzyme family protein [Paenibacillus taiwanensis]|uniref:phosphotransferase enzyme family protein n=1 Tax=Paenibacillus taiwanensis TaxID=401638 RepID=UPI000400B1C6|nr:aminoglycoside phosphotransferase family protein [Paenibacillus taiwanensis]
MTNDKLNEIIRSFGISKPAFTFLRHNENRTYRIDAADGSSYLLRIHQPFKEGMAGLQHTYEGLLGELEMLDKLSNGSDLIVQSPLRNDAGDLITVIEYEGKTLNCSMLTWLEGRDLNKQDITNREMVKVLGAQIAELHSFFRQYPFEGLEKRPSQGITYNNGMVRTIKHGLDRGLFTSSDVSVIEESVKLINSRLENQANTSDRWGLVHGDLGMGNMIVTPEGELCFIDFGFFGPGYYLLDVAMGASMIPSEHRDVFLEAYYGHPGVNADELVLLEGFMLVSIIGFYAFQMGNESLHDWMRERMPRLCTNYCIPFLASERIFYNV